MDKYNKRTIWITIRIVTAIVGVLIGASLQSCEQTDWNEKLNHKCEVCGAEYSQLAFAFCPYHSVCANCGRWYNNLENDKCPYCGESDVVDRTSEINVSKNTINEHLWSIEHRSLEEQ